MTDIALAARLPAAYEGEVQRVEQGAELHTLQEHRQIEARTAQQHQHGQSPYKGLDVSDVVKQRVFHEVFHVRMMRQERWET